MGLFIKGLTSHITQGWIHLQLITNAANDPVAEEIWSIGNIFIKKSLLHPKNDTTDLDVLRQQ